jgi:hypothetical protein
MLNMKVVRWIGIIVMGIIVGVGINQVFKTLISNNMPQSQEIILQGATVIPTKKIQNSQATVTSDDAQCNAKVTVWANQMHDVLIMMIETDDTKPKATQTSFLNAQNMLAQFSVPSCANQDIQQIDTGIRQSITPYVAWTQALLDGDTSKASELENQGDAFFGPGLDLFLKYENAHDKYRMSILLQAMKVLGPNLTPKPESTQAASNPTTAPATITIQKTNENTEYATCENDVTAFTPQIQEIFEGAQAQTDILEAYVAKASITGVDPTQVDALFEQLAQINAPLCINEPLEIVSYLGLMRDTLRPGFVEIKVELGYGNPDSESYARVRSWVGELHGFEQEITSRIKSIPKSLNALRTRKPTLSPKPQPTAPPVPTSNVATSSLSAACKSSVDRFLSDIDVFINRATGIRFDIQEIIAGRPRRMRYVIADAFAELKVMDVPTCTSEPAAIVKTLDEIRANELNAQMLNILEPGGSEMKQYAQLVEQGFATLEKLMNTLRNK